MPRLKADDVASPSLSPVAFMATEVATIKFFIWICNAGSKDSNLAVLIVPNECTVRRRWKKCAISGMDFMVSMCISVVVKIVVVYKFHRLFTEYLI